MTIVFNKADDILNLPETREKQPLIVHSDFRNNRLVWAAAMVEFFVHKTGTDGPFAAFQQTQLELTKSKIAKHAMEECVAVGERVIIEKYEPERGVLCVREESQNAAPRLSEFVSESLLDNRSWVVIARDVDLRFRWPTTTP